MVRDRMAGETSMQADRRYLINRNCFTPLVSNVTRACNMMGQWCISVLALMTVGDDGWVTVRVGDPEVITLDVFNHGDSGRPPQAKVEQVYLDHTAIAHLWQL